MLGKKKFFFSFPLNLAIILCIGGLALSSRIPVTIFGKYSYLAGNLTTLLLSPSARSTSHFDFYPTPAATSAHRRIFTVTRLANKTLHLGFRCEGTVSDRLFGRHSRRKHAIQRSPSGAPPANTYISQQPQKKASRVFRRSGAPRRQARQQQQKKLQNNSNKHKASNHATIRRQQ